MNNEDSFIIIKFGGVGSVEVETAFNNVTPLQVMAAASYLEVKGKNALVIAENERFEREQAAKLAVPDKHIILPGES